MCFICEGPDDSALDQNRTSASALFTRVATVRDVTVNSRSLSPVASSLCKSREIQYYLLCQEGHAVGLYITRHREVNKRVGGICYRDQGYPAIAELNSAFLQGQPATDHTESQPGTSDHTLQPVNAHRLILELHTQSI